MKLTLFSHFSGETATARRLAAIYILEKKNRVLKLSYNCLNNLIFKKTLILKEVVGPKPWWQMNDHAWHTQVHNQVLGVQQVSFFCSLS